MFTVPVSFQYKNVVFILKTHQNCDHTDLGREVLGCGDVLAELRHIMRSSQNFASMFWLDLMMFSNQLRLRFKTLIQLLQLGNGNGQSMHMNGFELKDYNDCWCLNVRIAIVFA